MEATSDAADFGKGLELEGFEVLVWELDRTSCGFRRVSGPLVRRFGHDLLSGEFATRGVLGEVVRSVAQDGLPRACRHAVRALDGSAVSLYSQVVPVGPDRISGLSLAVGESLSLRPGETALGAAKPELLLRGIVDGVTAQAADGRILYANEAAALHLGFASPDQLLALDPSRLTERYELFDEAGRPVAADEAPPARARRGQTVPPTPIRWRVRGGNEDFWSMVRATPVFDSEGQVQLAITIWHDISRQKQQEAQLRQQKALLEAQTQASPDGILVVSQSGEILSWNRRFLEIWGLDEDALENRSDEELIERVLPHISEPGQFIDRVQTLYEASDAARDEVRLRDGRLLVRHSSRLRGLDNAVLGRIWFFRDVTEMARARDRESLLEVERATREAAERAHGASEFLADASRLLSQSLDLPALLSALAQAATAYFKSWTLIDVVNPDEGQTRRFAAAPTRGLEPIARELEARIPPSPQQLLGGRFPDLEPEVVQGMPEFLEEGIRRIPWLLGAWDARSGEALRRLKLRSYLAVPIHKGDKVMGALTLGWGRGQQDLSRGARRLAEDLASRIALAVENAGLYQSARRAVAAREEFLSIASHELRTPIATIQLLSQGLLYDSETRTDRALPPWLQTKVRSIERQCRRLGVLVDRLLDATRIMSGRLELQPAPNDLSEVTREAISAFQDELALQGCTVTLHADEPVVGTWDRGRLEQIVTHLLTNASKYGGGKPLEVRVGQAGNHAFLEVTDHGVGIAPEAQARIFERFEHAAQSRHFAGLGLGLYIVRQVVDAMHGRIDVVSAPGQGSTFRVELPLEPAATH